MREDFSDLPALGRFGEELEAAGHRAATRKWWRRFALPAVAIVAGVGVTAAATAVTLRETVIQAPDPRVIPAEQAPVAGTATVSGVRSPDPAGGPPWTVRLTRSRTGLTCTTVGQVRGDVFGIVGQDGAFRAMPAGVSDACGSPLLLGARIVADTDASKVRSVVYGVAGSGTKQVVLNTLQGARKLELGKQGTFVAALPGYPEDSSVVVDIIGADGRREVHPLGTSRRLVPDLDGAPAWSLEPYVMGTRMRCTHMVDSRGPTDVVLSHSSPSGGRSTLPTACLDPRRKTVWAAYVQRFAPGDKGVPGFDRWDYHRKDARTMVVGVVRDAKSVTRVDISGVSPVLELKPTPSGGFAAVLPAGTRTDKLRITVHLKGGRAVRGRPGDGLVPDIVKSRRLR